MICSTPLCLRPSKARGPCTRCYAKYHYHQGAATDLTAEPQIEANPIHRLIAIFRAAGTPDIETARDLGINTRQIAAVLARPTISIYAADRMACALGYHPVEIWPDWGHLVYEEAS